MEAKDIVVKPDLTLLDQSEKELDGEMAWAIARYIEDAAEDVRLAKGKFWNVCKHGTREEICNEMGEGWNALTMQQLGIYATDHGDFLSEHSENLPYTVWRMAASAGISKGTKHKRKPDRADFFKKMLVDNSYTNKEIAKEIEKRRAKIVDEILEDNKRQEKEAEKKHGKPYEKLRTPYRVPKKPAITVAEACEFFGLSELSWITERSLAILYRGLSKHYHTDKGGGNGDMVKLNACHEILKKIVRK